MLCKGKVALRKLSHCNCDDVTESSRSKFIMVSMSIIVYDKTYCVKYKVMLYGILNDAACLSKQFCSNIKNNNYED